MFIVVFMCDNKAGLTKWTWIIFVLLYMYSIVQSLKTYCLVISACAHCLIHETTKSLQIRTTGITVCWLNNPSKGKPCFLSLLAWNATNLQMTSFILNTDKNCSIKIYYVTVNLKVEIHYPINRLLSFFCKTPFP